MQLLRIKNTTTTKYIISAFHLWVLKGTVCYPAAILKIFSVFLKTEDVLIPFNQISKHFKFLYTSLIAINATRNLIHLLFL